jgi:hypothetical protein
MTASRSLECHYIHTKSHENLPRFSKFDRRTHRMVIHNLFLHKTSRSLYTLGLVIASKLKATSSFIHRRYSPGWTLASLITLLYSSRYRAIVLHPLTPIVLRSCSTSSNQLFLGRPFLFVPCICPSVSS